MEMHTNSKIPLNLRFPDLVKADYHDWVEADPSTNTKLEHVPSEQHMRAQYRSPLGRANGNKMFRRYPDGNLDYTACAAYVIEALQIVRSIGPGALDSTQQAALQSVFPGLFDYIDSGLIDSIRRVLCDVTKEEANTIAIVVAQHCANELEWNAGNGGVRFGYTETV